MPAFRLDTGTAESHAVFDALPPFIRGALEAAFFMGVDLPEGDRDESDSFGVGDLDDSALLEIVAACLEYTALNAADLAALEAAGQDMEQSGRDFVLTMAGTGVGFLDRPFKGEARNAAGRLSQACPRCEAYLYLGDNGRVFVGDWPAGNLNAAQKVLDAARADSAALPQVGGRYGAPMGRRDTANRDAARVILRRVTLDPGGYDAGGAYWGVGADLWRAIDPEGGQAFTRAATLEAARQWAATEFPAAEIVAA